MSDPTLIAALPDRLQDLPNRRDLEQLNQTEQAKLWQAVQELQRTQLQIIQALKSSGS